MKKLCLLVVAIVLASCSEDVSKEMNGVETYRTVYFSTSDSYGTLEDSQTRVLKDGTVQTSESRLSGEALTRENTNADATTLSDVWVVQFNASTGAFKNAQYAKIQMGSNGMPYARLRLSVDNLGDASNIYYLVNSHDEGLITYYPENEQQFLSGNFLRQKVSGMNWCDTLGVPMYARSLNKKILNTQSTIIFNDTVSLKRLCAKLNFKIRSAYYSETDKVKVNKVHLRNVPESFNFLELDTADMANVPLTDFDIMPWNDSDPDIFEEVDADGTKYYCKQYSWYVPYSYPTSVERRMYVEAWGENLGDFSLYDFRIHDASLDYNIRSNTIYTATETLAGSAEAGKEDGPFQVLNFSNAAITDLSGKEHAANCYVLNTKLGTQRLFCFPIKQYNVYAKEFASVDGVEEITPSTRWSVDKLWLTNEDALKLDIMGCSGIGDGYVFIRVQPANDNVQPKDVYGNALIALRNADGDIIWSWHLWVHPQNVLADTYEFNGKTWLGRTLGAYKSCYVNAYNTEPTSAADWKETLGLYYQWGRKDPFRGLFGKGIAYSALAATEGGTTLTSDAKTISASSVSACRRMSIAEPATFFAGTSWLGCGDNQDKPENAWGEASGKKSVFDPCPPGFRVSEGEAYNSPLALNTTNFPSSSNATWLGTTKYNGSAYPYRLYSDLQNSFFLTASGIRANASGNVSGVGNSGCFWTSLQYGGGTQNGSYMQITSNTVVPRNTTIKSLGMSIRAVKE